MIQEISWDGHPVVKKHIPTKVLGPKRKTNASFITSVSMVKVLGVPFPKLPAYLDVVRVAG